MPLAKEQDPSQVEDLKATIIELEEKLADNHKGSAPKSETRKSENREQILAVLGGGTIRSGPVVVSSSLISTVNKLVQRISESPGQRVVIEGHTDNIPIKATTGKHYQDNMDLSYLRAKAIASILVENGISRERISVVGFGDTRPVASNDTKKGRAKNRRVVVKLVPVEREI